MGKVKVFKLPNISKFLELAEGWGGGRIEKQGRKQKELVQISRKRATSGLLATPLMEIEHNFCILPS